MRDIVVTKSGVIGSSPHRHIDVVYHPMVKEFRYFYFDNEEDNFRYLYKVYNRHEKTLNGKIRGKKFHWSDFFKSHVHLMKNLTDLVSLIPSAMMKVITQDITKADVLIIGDNDFDYSFGLASVYAVFGMPYVLTFKETRLRENDILERLAIEGATKVVVPHEGYVDFIKKKHAMDISKKVIFADVDWRSRFVYEHYIKSRKVKKLSKKDGKLHVCILSSRSIWDPKETRSKGRYYYVNIIKKLLEAGFTVHLHTRIIIKSLDEPIFKPNNPYSDLAKKYPKRFYIEKPIDLRKPEGYYKLMEYDLGLLTSGEVKDPQMLEFEQYNIPNRYYEYKHAGVIPIAPKGTLRYMEENFKDVVFFKDPEEIHEKLKDIEMKVEPEKTMYDLIDAIITNLF